MMPVASQIFEIAVGLLKNASRALADIIHLMVDWSKNGIDLHHGPFFQESDRVELPADPDQDESDIYRKTLRRSLGAVLPRLQLMGSGERHAFGQLKLKAVIWFSCRNDR
jgi:hypothetical protein